MSHQPTPNSNLMDPSLITDEGNDTPDSQHAPAPIPASAPADMQAAARLGTQVGSLGGSPTPATAPARAAQSKGKKKGSHTRARKPNRTPAQILVDEALAAQKRAEKSALNADRAAAAKKKKDDRAATARLRRAEKAEQATRLKWTEEALLELVAFVRMVKEDHTTAEHGMIGYAAFGKYFLNYSNKRSAEFPLLAGVENSSLLTRYRSLMGLWRQVKDHTDVSGSGGLLGALVEFGLSLSLWNAMLDMHGDNPAATAHGQGNIEDDLEALYDDSMSDGSDDESIGYLPDDLATVNTSADAEIPQTFVPRRSRRGRHPDDGLTAEELALDPQSSPPPESNPSCCQSGGIAGEVGGDAHRFRMINPPSPTSTAFRAIQPAGPADTATQETTGVGETGLPGPATPATPAPMSSTAPGRPMTRPPSVPAASRAIPRRRGRIDKSPKKEHSTGSAMLMMMHKSTEQSNLWMIEERKRAEQNRAEDRREAEAKATEKEQLREEQLRIAKEDRENALEQLRLGRKDAQARADLAELVRKEEREDALNACRLEADRYEASQLKRATLEAAQEKSRQMHDMAMMAMLRNFGAPPPAP
ncbi:hypothetical protein PSTT_09088 [Puccinia striiformis]|uniref:Uncharacterized protein n=1 Tax=Puccinia striiformis TaxID=27350 RepID=A0A2S4V9P6_9BASI|nr:hypothetical protein PSTT_09088 [Puccinia striiformis]